jgi:uncharacterized membrane protein
MKNIFCIGAILVFIVSSCYYDSDEALFPNLAGLNGQSKCDTTNVTFSGTIKPMIDQNCNTCHFAGNVGTGGIYLVTYSDISNQASSIYTSISSTPGSTKFMPKYFTTQLDSCTLKEFKKWMKAGTPNN